MMNRTIVVNGREPAPLSIRWPLGLNLDLRVTLKSVVGAPIDPSLSQFVLLPRTRGGVMPFDMAAHDVANGIARVEVPGTSLTDRAGYGIEMFSRVAAAGPTDPPWPTALIAKGVLATEGSAYMSEGPLNLINVPVVTGPPGPAGPAGVRGSIWTTGNGAPTDLTANTGDMYLDEDNGDVWRWSGSTWMRGTF